MAMPYRHDAGAVYHKCLPHLCVNQSPSWSSPFLRAILKRRSRFTSYGRGPARVPKVRAVVDELVAKAGAGALD
jgi:hypothetical protein